MESLTKYSALGNAYLVGLEDSLQPEQWVPGAVQTLCSTQHGIGADGLLCLSPLAEGRFKLTIWNPDGSQAEKSGNGIRIAAAYLWSKKHLTSPHVELVTASDTVSCRILNDG